MPAIVVDMDGTLSDHGHRAHLAKMKDWPAYNAAAYLDPAHNEVLDFLRDARVGCPECSHILLTARFEKMRAATKEWLIKKSAVELFDDIIMRPDDDYTSDAILKPRMLVEHFGGLIRAKQEVRMILEDRSSVVAAWRSMGFVAWQVREDYLEGVPYHWE